MTISQIKNPWLRRTLVILAVPLLPVVMIISAFWVIVEAAIEAGVSLGAAFCDMSDIREAVVSAWRGQR